MRAQVLLELRFGRDEYRLGLIIVLGVSGT
jgi:hypothetical protein